VLIVRHPKNFIILKINIIKFYQLAVPNWPGGGGGGAPSTRFDQGV
jgi:hypothetical protein